MTSVSSSAVEPAPLSKRFYLINWLLFTALCLIWGSSFMLMKLGLFDATGKPLLSAYQVAGVRMVTAGLVLLPFAAGTFLRIKGRSTRWLVFLSGILGSFIPAYLFCLAETKIDSSLAGAINSMTPLFVLLLATLVYGAKIEGSKWLGIMVGLAGCLLLLTGKSGTQVEASWYGLLAVLATVLYGLNVNMVNQKLNRVSSVDIATMAFVLLIIPSLVVLAFTGFFSLPLGNREILMAVGASGLLGVLGTALASILFYILVKRSGIVFSSLVTYGIPFVAIGWGVLYGETVHSSQVIALLIILSGVYVANMPVTKGLEAAKKILRRNRQQDLK